MLNRTLVIGRRWNVLWEKGSALYLPEEVTEIAKSSGQLHTPWAVDYFIIARNKFPWHSLPDLVIARRGYDNFLVMLSVRKNVSVVDVTNTLVAVHQTDRQAKDRRRHRVDREFNMRRLGRFNARRGLTSSSQYLTKSVWNKFRNDASIVVVRRPTAALNAKSEKQSKDIIALKYEDSDGE